MSFDEYFDQMFLGKQIHRGAIVKIDGTTATKEVPTIQDARPIKLNVSKEEATQLFDHFKNPPGVFESGLTIDGVKYMVIKADERSIYGKKGISGIVAVKTGGHVLIGCYHAQGAQPGAAANDVEKVADKLIKNGF